MRFVFIFLTLPLAAQPAYDLVISGARIVDGTGNAWFHGDLAVRGDRIARVTYAGALRDAQTKNRIDGRNLVLAPGFIDIQVQSPGPLLNGDGRLISKIPQGITPETRGEGGPTRPPMTRRSQRSRMKKRGASIRASPVRTDSATGLKRCNSTDRAPTSDRSSARPPFA